MKTLRFVFVLAFVLGLVLAPMSMAKAQTSLTYESCFQIQNLEAAQASVTISYYSQTSATPTDVTDTIAASGSKTYCPLNAVSNGFDGSVVISSDKQIAAIANVTGQGWNGFDASYAGFSAGATTVSVPLLMKGNYGFNTWFNVQNAGGTGPATVNISYSDGTTATGTIGVNQAKTFNQADETHSATVFAATVTSDQPVVVTVMEVGPTMLFAYNGFTSSVDTPVLPLVQANNYGFTTGVQIQNSGDTASTVEVTYTPSLAGTACKETLTIQPHASATYALHAWDTNDTASTNDCKNGETFIGSAVVTGNSAGVGLAAIINQQNFGTQKGAAYGSFDAATAGTTVVLPLIMDRNYGYFTGFNIMNVGTGDASVSCTFTDSSVTIPATTVKAGEALTHVQLNQLANGYVGSATCTATGTGAKIVGVVNELLNAGNSDTFLVYEAFSK